MSLKNGKSKHHKNIRQAYNELLDKHEQLVNAFMIMQRSMKLILLTQSTKSISEITHQIVSAVSGAFGIGKSRSP